MLVIETLVAFLVGTFLFDLVHFTLHQCLRSRYLWMKSIGRLHSIHHHFFPSTLQINEKWTKLNLRNHALLEMSVGIIGSALCLLFFSNLAVLIAIVGHIALFFAVCAWRGVDLHHRPYLKVPSYRGGWYVTADYHALHHVYPNFFYSGYIKLLDFVLGTSLPLQGRKIAMTGANGALGSNLKRLLEKEGAVVSAFKYGTDYDYTNYDQLKETLQKSDVLLLCHGSKYDNAQEANCDSFVQIIELFKSVRQRGLLPPEVWAVGSEIECHPCFGIKKIKVYAKSKRNYAKHARVYFRDRDIQYRHLVHAAFTSKMGPGLMTASFAARMTLFFLKRGFRYIPVTYTGFAYLNYFRFVFNF